MLLPSKDDAAIMPENRKSDEIRRRTAQLGGHMLSLKIHNNNNNNNNDNNRNDNNMIRRSAQLGGYMLTRRMHHNN